MSISQVNIWIDSLANWVWTTSGSASILILLLLAVQFLFRKRLSARWLYALWCCALIRLCLPGVPSSPLSAMNFFNQEATSPEFDQTTAGNVGDVPPHVAPAVVPEIQVDQVRAIAGHRLVPGPLKVLWLAGAFLYLAIIIRQHRRWEQRLRNEKAVDEPRLLQLLEEAKERVGCKGSVRLVKTEYVSSPTLFGWEDPTLLLPANLNITESELRLVMMHELKHVKRGDVLINWLAIVLQAMHWFNPFVWLGLRQFRAARELACDELVVRCLEPDERKTYGSMLINLVDATFNPSTAPTFVPIISQQKQMHRRITMIANFKPGTRRTAAIAGSILFILVCLTFTRAADRPAAAEPVIVQAAAPKPEQSNEAAQKGLARLEQIFAEYDETVAKKQAELDRMREEFKIVRAEDEGSNFNSESLRKLESARVEAMADSAQINTLLDQLKRLSRSELKKAILTASPDPSLSALVEQQSAAEQKLAVASENFGPAHPEVRTTQKLLATIGKQIDERVDGILEGMKAKAAAYDGKLQQIRKEIATATQSDIEAARLRRPYFKAKRDLENLQQARERLQLRLMQDKIDAAVPK